MATVPSETTVVAGSVLTAATWNSNVRDALNFLLAPPFAVMTQGTAQSIANNTWTSVLWDTESLDRDNGHSTTSNTSRYVAQTAGWYSSKTTQPLKSGTSAAIAAAFAVNGAASRFSKEQITGVYIVPHTSTDVYLNLNDYLEVQVYQGTGAAVNTGGDGSDGPPRWSIRWVST